MPPPRLQAFPSHREHAHLAKLPPPAKFHIVLGDGSAADDPNAVTFRARSSKGANEGHRTLRAALAALGGDELDTFPGMNVESENVLRLEPLSSRRTFTTSHGEAAVALR